MPVNPTVKVELSLADPADPAVWWDISDYVLLPGIQTSRGRNSELDRFQAGTGGVALNNNDGRFDPTYQGDLNLITNPSFDVDLAGWTVFGTGTSTGRATTDSVFGIGSLFIAFNGSGASYGREITVTGLIPGAQYVFSGYLKRTAAVGKINLDVFESGVIDTSGITIATGTGTIGSTWQRFSEVFTYPLTGSGTAKVRVFGDGTPAGALVVDAIQLELGSVLKGYVDGSSTVLVNRIVNPSFETNTTGYTAFLSTIARSALVAGPGTGGFGLIVSLTNAVESEVFWDKDSNTGLVPGTAYAFSLAARLAVAGSHSMTIRIDWYNGAALLSKTTVSFTINSTAWDRFSVAGIAPAGTNRAYLVFGVESSPSGIFDVYTDAWQFEVGAMTPYVDSTRAIGHWVGTAHASQSYRTAPYWPNLRPKNRIRITDEWANVAYPKIDGYVDGWAPEYPGPNESVVNLRLADAFSLLSTRTINLVRPYVESNSANLLRNPSFELDTVDYAVSAGALVQVEERDLAFSGGALLQYTTANTIDSHVRYEKDANVTVSPGLTYTASIYAKRASAGSTPWRLQLAFYNGATFVNEAVSYVTLDSTEWQRFFVCGTAGALADRAYIVFGTLTASGVYDVYTDAWVFEQASTNIGELPEERSDLRIGRVLDINGWPAGERVLSVGASTLLPQTELTGVSELSYLQLIEQSETGRLWIDRKSRVKFLSRWDMGQGAYLTPQATFGQSSADLRYVDLIPSHDMTFIRNEVRLTGIMENAIEQVALDAVSIGHYGSQELKETGLLVTDNELKNAAEYKRDRYATSRSRFLTLELAPGLLDPTVQWPIVLALELSDRITVKFTPPGRTGEIVQDCFIEGIKHNWTRSGPWRITLTLSAYGIGQLIYPEGKGFWTLGTSPITSGTGVLVY